MIKNLGLDIPEAENIDLNNISIDWKKFNSDCVLFYNKWQEIGQTLNLKTHDTSIGNALQIRPLYLDWAFRIDSNDSYYRIQEFVKRKNKSEKIGYIDQSTLNYYVSDISENFPYIREVLTKIENYTSITFGRVKLVCVNPLSCEVIHTDDTDTRYHIPIVTNDNVFFVENNNMYHMRGEKKMYVLHTSNPHTVVNAAGSLKRLHLIAHNKQSSPNSPDRQLIESTFNEFLKYAKEDYKNTSKADIELNKHFYKLLELEFLKKKKNI
jgi:hypothetical protein